MENSRKKQNNSGMSLIEIVVVVLILGILSAGAVVGFSFIRSRDASSAAETIVSLLNRTKTETLASKETVKLQVMKDGNKFYGKIIKGSEEIDKVEIGGNGISIVATGGGSSLTIDMSHPCEISYNKSNGAFSSSTYTKFVITGAKTSTVYMVTGTGRCYME
ncbi:MAG: type II secretion system protein [Lachnospiraceae bacterium]|nr:type II secretion system protein [Lachnospiraceae bacterium]